MAVSVSYRSNAPEANLEIRLTYRLPGDKNARSYYARTRISVTKDYWTNEHHKTKEDFPNYRDAHKINELNTFFARQAAINAGIKEISDFISQIFNYLTDDEKENLTSGWLKEQVKLFYEPAPTPVNEFDLIPKTLAAYTIYYLENNTHLKPLTVAKFQTFRNRLLKYASQPEIELEAINDSYRTQLAKELSSFDRNTIELAIKLIKTILFHARRKGFNIHRDVENWRFSFEASPIIYLNPIELAKIRELTNLPGYLDNARDWLLIGCSTGQRQSDLLRFRSSMLRDEISDKGQTIIFIEFSQTKTGVKVSIPVNDEVQRILAKRNGNFPRQISDVKFNDYLKQVCKIAGLTEPTKGKKTFVDKAGRKRKVPGVYPKCDLISSHVCRRSFCSNFFGIAPNQVIMSISGHKTESEYLKYIGKASTELSKAFINYHNLFNQ